MISPTVADEWCLWHTGLDQNMFHELPGYYGGISSDITGHDIARRMIDERICVPSCGRSFLNPFPPVLTPIWIADSQTILGLWRHWFSHRRPTFTEFYGYTVYGKRNMVFERGRTLRQAIYGHLFDCITNGDGIDDEIRTFAMSCEIDDLHVIDQLSLSGGDAPSLLSHPEFCTNPPLSLFDRDDEHLYTGDFPTSVVAYDPSALRHCCVYEIHSGYKNLDPDFTLREMAARNCASPAWFRTTSQDQVFSRLLKADDLEGAWMCLNSPEWRLGDARQAIIKLAAKAKDRAFSEFAESWVSLPFGDDEVI